MRRQLWLGFISLKSVPHISCCRYNLTNRLNSCTVPKLMYSFGDDKQVAADSVNVMEEILLEYIVDLVRSMPSVPIFGLR